MAETIVTILIGLILVAGCTLVAIIATTAFGRMLPRLEQALGLSMLLMGMLLYLAFPGTGSLAVVGLVVASHAIAGGLIWYRKKIFGR
ncbi:hypothetical protein [Sediminicoccus sp. KRV36]|uniref:hypothetical protein n=1 Tax=Sediminicoccus sp. KRV36 TaxID=3133721 RepID=UPI002010B134|nr:hypothetical protein [Sediminicoccus rosea]UPY36908.1 hypothetical protein LHU95_22255 [Sediminicoccus rosea]